MRIRHIGIFSMRLAVMAMLLLAMAATATAYGAQALAAEAAPVSAPAPPPAAEERLLPAYVRVLQGTEDSLSIVIPDSTFNLIAGSAIFKVNRTELRPGDPFLAELADVVIPTANGMHLMLKDIDLRGGASPEGPYWNNVRLAKGRAAALREYLQTEVDSVDIGTVASITEVPEDYAYLLWMLERDHDPAAPRVREIIDVYTLAHPDKIKTALRLEDGGRLWSRLLRDYYPFLRAARVVITFQRIRPEFLDAELPEPELPAPSAADLRFPDYRPSLRVRLLERPHMLAVSSNLLYDAFYMPNYGWAPMLNISAEFFPRAGHFTYRAGFTGPYYHKWAKHKFFQIRDYHLEARYYVNPGKLHTGAYGAAYLQATRYGIGFSARKGWQGEGAGAGLKAGYVVPLGSGRCRLDFHVAAGAFYTRFDPYVWGNPITGEIDGDYYYDWIHGSETFHKRNYQRWWLGPTEVGISLTFDALYYRLLRPGVSVIGKETVL